jgi:hypothetical protein
MSIDKERDENIPDPSEAECEEIAGQEEIYLEECVERFREHEAIVAEEFYVKYEESRHVATPPEADQAAEELIDGDSDDAPLSEEAIAEMLRARAKAS